MSTAMQAIHGATDTPSLTTAVAVVQQMADMGDEEAAFRLGRYYDRESTEPDYDLALTYYQMASAKDHAWATNNLGVMYQLGLGVPRDRDKGSEYIHKAASQHSEWAYLNLADEAFKHGGKGAFDKGIKWLEEGGRNQCTVCLIDQATIYHSGASIRDDAKVLTLLHKAAALGDAEATLIIAELCLVGDGVPQSAQTAFEMLKT